MSSDKSRPPFILPKSLKRRRLGLIESAMPSPLPRPCAEHLELLSENGRATGPDAMLNLMRDELDRLQAQADPSADPDTYDEILLATVIGDVLADTPEHEQRAEYLMILGYLYGRLTVLSRENYTEATRRAIADIRRQTGFWSKRKELAKGRQWITEQAIEIWRKDRSQELRIGAVTSMIRDKVLAEIKRCQEHGDNGPRTHWPKSLDSIQRIIRAVAPDYATKPGAPRRT